MKIATVTATRRPWMWDNLLNGLLTQERKADRSVVVCHGLSPVPLLEACKRAARYPLYAVAAPESWALGALLNRGLAMAFDAGADVACIWDDDDRYAPTYLAGVERELARHPWAWLVGKHPYWTEWPEEPARKPIEYVAPSHASGRARWLAGPTISVARRAWEAGARYRDDAPVPDGLFLQDVAKLAESAGEVDANGRPIFLDGWPPFYSTGSDDFALRRFSARHGHAWADPR